ncbi:hypothetical protein J4772_10770 [Cohnella sp. LGH]|uniref:hypothetical protein n=1 Tax=Cohnella sp. LGH TaxID=1619153 RepID=UPI001ADB424D|nr:hypothetical protein [Cohnella sp. LGH]QTH44832.1 hypothetical protein J4772_10770 [Cohnella sp. LGH]
MHKIRRVFVTVPLFLTIFAGCSTQASQESQSPDIDEPVYRIHEDQLLGELSPSLISTINIYEGGSTSNLVGKLDTLEQYTKLSDAVKSAQLITGAIVAIGPNFEFEIIYKNKSSKQISYYNAERYSMIEVQGDHYHLIDSSIEQIDALLIEAGISSP